MKYILAALLVLTYVFTLPACTKSTKEDGAEAEEEVISSTDEGASAVESSGNPDESQAGFLDDQLPEDSLGAKTEEKPADTTTPDTSAANPQNSSDSSALDLSLDSPAPTPEQPAPTEPSPMVEAPTEPTPPPVAEAPKEEPAPVAATSKASLQKVKDVPFREGDQLLNSVYIARPGDDYKKISQMIYGTDEKAKDLKKANPGMKTVKAGNKVYYNSPKRSDDETRILNYYEDIGMTPEVYITKDGENIRTLSKDLLGYKDAWKEVWATNTVESKDVLAAGTELKYWKGGEAVAPKPTTEVATNMPPPTELPPADMPPPPPVQASQDLPPPPPPEMNVPPAGDLPPPPADLPPPPPAVAQELPPPPPPMEPPAPKKQKPALEEEAMDQDTIMALGGAGIIAAALAALIVIRKRKQKAADFGNQINVG